ncbi:cAMP-dependent protein kinase catalytic subunit alpha-like [Nilaparvata lugens]|uniref:cAMP-dependent protein kinase catalytic subunit alpha-like n=1 Tax=Nilaparvata lugens TaxID=108931 RepID=UPI00193E16C0|nr:cAMP-dependent protein kinase catalytic subunit alpha-like [Nilaparvata lugens]
MSSGSYDGARKSGTIHSLTEFLAKEKTEFDAKFKRRVEYNISRKDFDFLVVLGSGSFGKVYMVKKRVTGSHYAVKVMSKRMIVKKKQLEHTHNEKCVLEILNCPFTVHLVYFFQDNSHVYFVMPLILGGELFMYLRKSRKFPETQARFYAAQVILGIEYLHNLDLIYRDLKPENIMIDQNGYLKITDFGFCKLVKTRTYTLCGTPDYLAPEIILSKGYGKSVDYWSFGILIYEMCAGYPPFYSKDQMKLYERIVAGRFKYASSFTNELCDLLSHILQTDVSKRYGILKNGVNDIKNHQWFRPVEWLGILNHRVVAPYTPDITNPADTSNFYKTTTDFDLRVSNQDTYAREFANF